MLYSDNLSAFELIHRANTRGIGRFAPTIEQPEPNKYEVHAEAYWGAYAITGDYLKASQFCRDFLHMTQEELNSEDFHEALYDHNPNK